MSCGDGTFDEELICQKIYELMDKVRWRREGDNKDRMFVKKSRRVKIFSDVSNAEQPACFQAEHNDTQSETTAMPYKLLMEINWIIYQDVARDPNAIGATENNLILAAVRKALAPDIQDEGFHDKRNTLGGLVHHLYIGGKIFKDPGDLDGQGMLVIPIKVLVPS